MRYTDCPAKCGAAVGIREHNQVNFCCSDCFAAHWALMLWDGTGPEPQSVHSKQCEERQDGRRDVTRESGTFTLISKSRRDKVESLGQNQKA